MRKRKCTIGSYRVRRRSSRASIVADSGQDCTRVYLYTFATTTSINKQANGHPISNALSHVSPRILSGYRMSTSMRSSFFAR